LTHTWNPAAKLRTDSPTGSRFICLKIWHQAHKGGNVVTEADKAIRPKGAPAGLLCVPDLMPDGSLAMADVEFWTDKEASSI